MGWLFLIFLLTLALGAGILKGMQEVDMMLIMGNGVPVAVEVGSVLDIEDHAIDRMLSGLPVSNVERAAYESWSDRVGGRELFFWQELTELYVIAETVTRPVFETEDAARRYAVARAHNAVKG